MAPRLNLKSKWVDDDTIAVSWVDVKIKERKPNFFKDALIVIVAVGVFIFTLFIALTELNFLLIILYILGLFGYIIVSAMPQTVPNLVTFGKDETTHNGRKFPTANITRFEMGSELALLGSVTTKPLIGEKGKDHEANQTLVRMWVDDVTAYDLSKNSWQQPENHQIRDALAKALDAVRNRNKQEEHEEKFGKVSNDTGMPEY